VGPTRLPGLGHTARVLGQPLASSQVWAGSAQAFIWEERTYFCRMPGSFFQEHWLVFFSLFLNSPVAEYLKGNSKVISKFQFKTANRRAQEGGKRKGGQGGLCSPYCLCFIHKLGVHFALDAKI